MWFQKYAAGEITIKKMIIIAVLCIIFIISLSFGAAAFGFRWEGDAAPQYDSSSGATTGALVYPEGADLTVLGKCLDEYIAKKEPSSPLKGTGAAFAQAGKDQNINPALLVAMAVAESSLGTTGKAKNYPNAHNYRGKFNADGSLKEFSSWEEAIQQHAQDLRENYFGLSEPLDTVEKIQGKYAPSGAKNDPTDLNSNWVKNVNAALAEINKKCPMTAITFYSKDSSSGDKSADFIKDKIQTSWYQKKNDSGDPVVSDRGKDPTGVVLHWTVGGNVSGATGEMSSSGALVHLIIDTDGSVYKTLPFTKKVTSGSGSASDFAIGIEIVSIAGGTTAQNEQALMGELSEKPRSDGVKIDRTAQFNAVIKTIKFLQSTYPGIANEKGDGDNLDAERGIFGHLQTQSKVTPIIKDGKIVDHDRNWTGFVKGCRTAKSDPGKRYMRKVWAELGSTGSDCLDS